MLNSSINVSHKNGKMIINYSDQIQSITDMKTGITIVLKMGSIVKEMDNLTIGQFERQQEMIMLEADRLKKFNL